MVQLDQIKTKWYLEHGRSISGATDEEISLFQQKNNVLLPSDLISYFRLLNGTREPLDSLFEFFSISRVKSIFDEYQDWEGIPPYRELLNKIEDSRTLFVFANYSFHLFSYAIRLDPENLLKNEVFILCGGDFRMISDSFTEFMDLYLADSATLYF
ncbi:SMI1/KNR4 family protein [Parachryseolinea silvisoli]|uniref:SMI1/KNR4 family protein n=1 Tax=Parachryseolinea silvisoli TaxID=2873601 RepID=UPI002265A89C|nr:SMI1/KNR4 family protein [Parachryseolinea silvisoli]MCD9019844.1 SMI1/KNR4 family protein [Parachryseolinea silvisoli]